VVKIFLITIGHIAKIGIPVFSLVLAPAITLAHHSRAEFADETMEISGILTEVIWRNPHIALFIDVESDSGDVETWRVEGWTNPVGLDQSGVTRDLFEVGKALAVVGQMSKFRSVILGTNVLLANGTEAIIAPNVNSHWDGPTIGGESLPPPQVADAATDNQGFFRAWYPSRSPMMFMRRFPYTEEAMAARANWDPVDNPLVRCEEPGMPMPLFHPRPILFSEQGQDIGLHLGYFDIERTVHMDNNLIPENQPPSHLGFSKGEWVDERTLLIETTRINYPYIDIDGTPQSEAVQIIERYSISEDQARLDLRLTIDDPFALTETVTVEWHFLALDEPFSVYECNVF
jgi:hypothetical protein